MHFAGNVVAGSRDTLIHIFTPPLGSTWENNTVWATGTAVAVSTSMSLEGLHKVIQKHGSLTVQHACHFARQSACV